MTAKGVPANSARVIPFRGAKPERHQEEEWLARQLGEAPAHLRKPTRSTHWVCATASAS